VRSAGWRPGVVVAAVGQFGAAAGRVSTPLDNGPSIDEAAALGALDHHGCGTFVAIYTVQPSIVRTSVSATECGG
jgi:hypothetical protein